jgi:hypothetical protein
VDPEILPQIGLVGVSRTKVDRESTMSKGVPRKRIERSGSHVSRGFKE